VISFKVQSPKGVIIFFQIIINSLLILLYFSLHGNRIHFIVQNEERGELVMNGIESLKGSITSWTGRRGRKRMVEKRIRVVNVYCN